MIPNRAACAQEVPIHSWPHRDFCFCFFQRSMSRLKFCSRSFKPLRKSERLLLKQSSIGYFARPAHSKARVPWCPQGKPQAIILDQRATSKEAKGSHLCCSTHADPEYPARSVSRSTAPLHAHKFGGIRQSLRAAKPAAGARSRARCRTL